MHYVCIGECGGVSEIFGVCGAADCSKHRESLQPYDCRDGRHKDRKINDKKRENDQEDLKKK